ncbi:hypothetical protein [Arthrobacter globiformis]|uniref:hypothetical protein n=1 Tax=Arthrobacter globiformis TaxID=1665 RepID=UPI0027921381|nr:hypothetical protein [Arthrobacter globiformis]MDQ0618084.1 hypothetical protein [Arthrobacter globiformis]
MKDQLSQSCVQWAHQRFLRSANLNGGASTVATTWIWSFGKVAGEVQNYLESGHLVADALPASLVHEILELAQDSYARFPDGDARSVLIDIWRGLAHVYDAAGSSENQEMDRLEMLTDWIVAIEELQYSGYPGLRRMAAAYRAERRRLDLTKLRHDRNDFNYVGALLDLLKLYEPRPRHTRSATAAKSRGVDDRKPAVRRSGQSTATRDQRHVGLAKRSMEALADELYGNWRDHWRNTLPELA